MSDVVEDLFSQARNELATVRDLLRFSVSRFRAANLFFGHGSDSARDEAAYLILHTLKTSLSHTTNFYPT